MRFQLKRPRNGAVLILAVLAAMWLPEALAANDTPSFARRVAGTFFVEEGGGTKEWLTFYEDGNVLLNSSAEGEFQFGSSQGVWTRIGRRTIAFKVANFDFDDHGIAVVDFEITFDRNFRTFTGEFSGALYSDDVDPLDPGSAVPLFTFQDDVDGRRMLAR